MYITLSSWHGPFSTCATASPPSSPGPPVGMSGTQVCPQGGSLFWSWWGTWNWGCVFVLEINPDLWPLSVSPDSTETEGHYALGLGPFCGLQY